MEMLKILIIIILTFACTYLFCRNKNKKRINELIKTMENLNNGNYNISLKQDDFSILEDSIYKLFVEIVEERENTEKLSKRQSKNLEDIAHQIKTPITAMSFKIENMNSDNDDIISLKKQIERLNSLTDILLKLSSLEVNINKMKNENINLRELVEYSLDILEGDIKENNINIEKENLNENIIGDYYWLSEAIINILNNSIKVSKNKSIYISSNSNPIYTELSFLDEGGGIKEENLNKIFRRFYKTPDSNGFGIGLSMAKTIINANNADIEVINSKSGAKFIIKFYKVT